jgi:hypothetical protein
MSTDWIVVHIAQGEFEEDQVRAFLEAHDIPTHVRGEALRKTHGLVLDGLGQVEVLVPADRADDARDLLERVHAGDLELSDSFVEPGADAEGA